MKRVLPSDCPLSIVMSDFFSYREPHRVAVIRLEDVREAQAHVFDEDLQGVPELKFT